MENQITKMIAQSKSYKLIVKEELERKIRFLCNKLPNNEYSGSLLYTVEGSFEDDNLVILAQDFYLQDIGTSGYTEYNSDVTLADYMIKHDLFNCYVGALHSHNNMATIFTKGCLGSSTDMNTLEQEGKTNNHFVSLIVNNAGNYAAAITRKIEKTITGACVTNYSTFNNKVIPNIKAEEVVINDIQIEYFMLDIEIEHPVIEKNELEERLEELQKNANTVRNRGFGIQQNFENFKKNLKPNTQLELFEKDEDEDDDYYIHNEDSENSNTDLQLLNESNNYTINPETINNQVLQIITGNLFAQYMKTLNIDDWAKNMEKVYNKRFPEGTFDNFEVFADSLVEMFQYEITNEEDCSVYEEDFVLYKWTSSLIKALQKYESNDYLDYYIKSLKRYTYE